MDAIENAAKALEELFAPWVIPDIIVDSSIPVPNDIRLLFKSLASELSDDDRRLLDFGRRQFEAYKPHYWAFHNTVFDNKNAVQKWIVKMIPIYNGETGEDISFEDGLWSFQNLIMTCEEKLDDLLGEEGKSLDVARKYFQLVASLVSTDNLTDTPIELLVNETFNFALACINDNTCVGGPLTCYWMTQRGVADILQSSFHLKQIIGHLKTPDKFEKACQLATVIYFGFRVHDKLHNNISPIHRLPRSERDEKPTRQARQLFLDFIKRLFGLKDKFNSVLLSGYLGTYLQYANENCVLLPREGEES